MTRAVNSAMAYQDTASFAGQTSQVLETELRDARRNDYAHLQLCG